MRRDESLGLGAIHADDELLDRLGRRDDVESTQSLGGLEGLLAQWTAQIDADAESVADRSGPWGLRGRGADVGCAHEVAPIVPRTVRIPVSRAAAIAGVLALTMSGGGVAAALTGQDVPLMSRLSNMVAKARPSAPEATPTSAEPMDDAVLAAVGSRLRDGKPQEARKIVAALQDIAGTNPDPVFAAKVELLDQQVEHAEILAAGTPATTTSPTDLPSVLALGPTVALGLPSSPVTAFTTLTTGPLAPTTGTSPEQSPLVVAPSTSSEPRDEASPAAPSTPAAGTTGSTSSPSGSASTPAGSGSSTSTPSTGTGSPSTDPTSSPTHGVSPTPSDSATASGVRPIVPTPSAGATTVLPTTSPSSPSETAEPSEPVATPSPTPTPTTTPTSESPTTSSPGGTTSISPTSDATTPKVGATTQTTQTTLTRGGTSSQRVRSTALRPLTKAPIRAVVTQTSTTTDLSTR